MMHLHIGHMFFGAGNVGDDLTLAGFLIGIAEAMPELKVTCATPFDIEAQRRRFPQIEWSVYSPATRDPLIAACDVWLGLGGAVLQATEDGWLLADQVLQLEECHRRGKPVFFLGCGIDYRADANRPGIRLLLDSARWIWTRDARSATALKRMGFNRATAAADLSHLPLCALPPAPFEPDCTGFVCSFELAAHYTVEVLSNLIVAASGAGRRVPWLVQEARVLPGSELDLYSRLPAATRGLIELRRCDYGTASTLELIKSWGRPGRFFSTRFHGAIIGAWFGSRVVVFERQQKLQGIAQDLGIASFASMPDPGQLAQAFERAQPVPQSVLNAAADQAQRACTAFLMACRSLDALALVSCEERDGVIVVAGWPGPREAPAPITELDEHAAAIQHFIGSADRFRALLKTYCQAPHQQGLEQLSQARDAAVYALLGLPGSVIRTRLEAPVSSLIAAILESGVRRLPRTAEEEATFIECWRRLANSWNEDAGFAYGLAALAFSRHGFELIALQPLTQDLGWAEPFWLQCLMETLPTFLQPGAAHRSAGTLPPADGAGARPDRPDDAAGQGSAV